MNLNWLRCKHKLCLLLLIIITVWPYTNCTHGLFLNWRFLEDAIQQISEFTSRASRSANKIHPADGQIALGTQFQTNYLHSSNSTSGAEEIDDTDIGDHHGHNQHDHYENPFNSQESESQLKCFEELGCIEITEEWFDILHRPLNLLPLDRHKIHTRFILYTRRRVTDPIEVSVNRSSLLDSGFNPSLPLKFVIHGFIDTGYSSWVVKLSQQLTTHSDVNVFAVDWGGGSLSFYTQATANTRVVGLELAHFIKFLMNEFNVDPKNIHLIGHSLGAHIAGYAGQKVFGLGRITGLDPAEPYFQHMPAFVRLDESDASFVDVIHTDGRTILLGGYGMIQPCGHVDFYPNNGKEQPGCDLAKNPMNLINAHGLDQVQREIFACNHHRAIYYFIESLLTPCPFIAHRCPDYDSYLMGQCYSCGPNGLHCAKMGIDADQYPVGNRTNVKFYLTTAKSSPFCAYHYRINLQMAYPRQAAPWVTGKLRMNIKSTDVIIRNINLSPTENLRVQHGTNLTFMIQNNKQLGVIQDVQIEWKYNSNYLDVMAQCWRFICNNKLFLRRIDVTEMDPIVIPKQQDGRQDSLSSSSSVPRQEETDDEVLGMITPETVTLGINEGDSTISSNNVDNVPVTTMVSHHSFTFALCGEVGTKYTGISSGAFVTFDRSC